MLEVVVKNCMKCPYKEYLDHYQCSLLRTKLVTTKTNWFIPPPENCPLKDTTKEYIVRLINK